MSIVSTSKDGKISYDDFIAKMDANLTHRHHNVQDSINEQLFKKVHDCLVYSGESLYDALKTADLDDTD